VQTEAETRGESFTRETKTPRTDKDKIYNKRRNKMAVKIRLTRLGDKKSPFYRIVVADSRAPRDGKFIEVLGTFDPLIEKDSVKVDAALVEKWLGNGATPTDTAKAVLVKAGVMKTEKFKAKANAKAPTPKPKKKDAKK
jgi:small subunit ribosomal protein S16